MSSSKSRKHRARKTSYSVLVVLIIFILAYVSVILVRPVKAIPPTLLPNPITATGKLKVTWPNSDQAAVGVLGFGSLESNGDQTPTPTASIAKVVTSLAVLQKYPLSPGEQGPTITLTNADVNDYNNYVAEDGSVVKVAAGEQLSEYQALQAMLLPSANNMADTLAIWAFGSMQNYVTYANKMTRTLGLNSTTIADASGFSPNTVSTSVDLVKLGEAALYNPVIAQIVDQPTANLPVAGLVTNVDWFVGQYNLIGIKTGNTDQAGGCFLSAAKYDLGGGNSITVIGAVMKAPTLQNALNETLPMLQSVKDQIQLKTIPAGTAVTSYNLPWADNVTAVTKTSLIAPYLPEMPVSYTNSSVSAKPFLEASSPVGRVKFGVGNTNSATSAVLTSAITKPNVIWKLTHPQYIL